MAFTKHTLPDSGTPWTVAYGGGRWFVWDSYNFDRFHVTADWSAFVTVVNTDISLSGPIEGVCFDGTNWRFVSTSQNGLWTSTDGSTGATWSKTTPDFSNGTGGATGGRAKLIHATPTGRLIVLTGVGVSYSDDGGATWTVASTAIVSTANENDSGIAQYGSDLFAWSNSTSTFLHSANNGTSWSTITGPTLAGRISSVAKIPAGWLIATLLADDVPRITTDGGSSWSSVAGFTSDRYCAVGNGSVVVVSKQDNPIPVLSYSANLVDWGVIDTTGATADYYPAGYPLVVGGTTLALVAGEVSSDPGVYTGPMPAVAGIEPIAVPVRLQVDAEAGIGVGLRLQVGDTGAVITTGARLSVVPDAVLGGLDGAGGWPSAPTGRWQAVATLAGADISDDLVGEVVVSFADNEARTAEFSFLPGSVIQPMGLIGQKVQIAFAQRGTSEPESVQVIFTGVVETPSIDLQTGVVYCMCHDQLQEVFVNTDRAWIDANVGGRWREEISGEAEDNWDYLEARRLSVPVSVALDAFQSPRVVHWASGLLEETVQTPDMIDGTLSVDLPSRDEIRTRVTVSFEYRFERLRGRGVTAGYSNPISFYISDPSKLWLTSAMVKESAEKLSGWTIDSLRIENPNPGSFWRGASIEDGVYVIPPAVAPDLALGFTARYHTRWQQTLTQAFTVDLVLPDLEAQIGKVTETISATMDVPFEATDWASDDTVLPTLAIPTVGDVVSPWQPVGSDNDARDEALRTLLDQAWVKLWSASRSGRVRFSLPLRPNMWLDNLVTVNATRINARGRVVEGEHRMNVDTGEAVTTVALAVGLPGDAAATQPTWTLPTVPALDETRPPETYSFECGTYVGGLLTSPVWDEETMIGFVTNVELPNALAENFYPHQLSIKAPDVAAEDRDPITQDITQTVETTIPTDLLELL